MRKTKLLVLIVVVAASAATLGSTRSAQALTYYSYSCYITHYAPYKSLGWVRAKVKLSRCKNVTVASATLGLWIVKDSGQQYLLPGTGSIATGQPPRSGSVASLMWQGSFRYYQDAVVALLSTKGDLGFRGSRRRRPVRLSTFSNAPPPQEGDYPTIYDPDLPPDEQDPDEEEVSFTASY